MTRPLALPVHGPIGARLSGLAMLLEERVLSMHALSLVAEDLADGVLRDQADDRDLLRVVADGMRSEVLDLERLVRRLKTLVTEARR